MLRILIAEDDLISRVFLSKFLSRYGSCDMAEDGLKAIEVCMTALDRGTPYDLICLDIMMPKVDGVKVLKAVRDMEGHKGILPAKRSKVIMTTALAEGQFVQNAFEYGCEAYASKPIDLGRMVAVMEKLGLIDKKDSPGLDLCDLTKP